MTQEDKQLLLIDLCTRLPYGVRIQVKEWATVDTELKVGHIDRLQYDEIKVKPYLRPMSSMTEEEKKTFSSMSSHSINCLYRFLSYSSEWYYFIHNEIDWLNAHHLDYRNLIESGLALEAPDGMYEINKK